MINITFLDDDLLFLNHLTDFFSQQKGYNVSGSFSSTEEFLEAYDSIPIDFLCLELQLQDAHGLDIVRKLRDLYYPGKIIILTNYPSVTTLMTALHLGVNGFLDKNIIASELLQHIRSVKEGGVVLTPIMMRIVVDNFRPWISSLLKASSLSTLDQTILELLKNGATLREISDSCHISVATVKRHLLELKKNYNAKNTNELIAILGRGSTVTE